MNGHRSDKRRLLQELAGERILVLDGGMGTMIQAAGLTEADYRGEILEDHPCELAGNGELLCLTRPDFVAGVHEAYLAAGADIITTNTFGANAISQRAHGTAHLVRDMNLSAAHIAKEAARTFGDAASGRPRLVAGSISSTSKSASISPDPDHPERREVDFDELVEAYSEQVRALLEGGVDILLLETVFDTLNAKAALYAISGVEQERGEEAPVWISASIADKSGRLLSGQTVESFLISIRHAQPVAVGLNCSFGASRLMPHVDELSSIADTLVTVHPNAGLPDEQGAYREPPETMASQLREVARRGLVNIVGGCCGTTPEHTRAMVRAVHDMAPREFPPRAAGSELCGLDALRMRSGHLLVNVGERANVAGSRAFARLIREERYDEAAAIARKQVRSGAQIIDVNVDDPLIDASRAMERLLSMIASDPEIVRVPVMIDSSRMDVIEAGLRCLQGKCVVNSLSLSEGEDELRRRAEALRRHGAAVVLMAIDEVGQADTLERRKEILTRGYRVLVRGAGLCPEDIVVDPNVFAVATGLLKHSRSALDFFDSVRWAKEELEGVLTCGGISNCSHAFRGNEVVREAMNAVFLHHAVRAGLDLAIVNAGRLPVYDDIDPELREAIEDVLLVRRADAESRLVALASRQRADRGVELEKARWRKRPARERLRHAMVHGLEEHVAPDTMEALGDLGDPILVIEGPLMGAMNEVGALFGQGKMFLPQVLRSARVMKLAVEALGPSLGHGKSSPAQAEDHQGDMGPAEERGPPAEVCLGGRGARDAERRRPGRRARILLATVKGDVHDIGKNILKVVLDCGGHEIVDLGVMVPMQTIVDVAVREDVDIVGVSGLITPSLDEMVRVASEMQRRGLEIPLLVGGAGTSRAHTALRLDPLYDGPVLQVPDASKAPGVVSRLMDPMERAQLVREVDASYAALREKHEIDRASRLLVPIEVARSRGLHTDWSSYRPPRPSRTEPEELDEIDLGLLRPLIDWPALVRSMGLRGPRSDGLERQDMETEVGRLVDDASRMLDRIEEERLLRARGVARLFPAARRGDDVVVFSRGGGEVERAVLHFLRRQAPQASSDLCPCLADLVAPEDAGIQDWIGAFVVSAGFGADELAEKLRGEGDELGALLVSSLPGSLTEAMAKWVCDEVLGGVLWGEFLSGPRGARGDADAVAIRPAEQPAEDGFCSVFSSKEGGGGGLRVSPGYAAYPDHTEKQTILSLLDAGERVGVGLTESFMMVPAATVSGLYFAHPKAERLAVGRIGRDQVADYASRKGWGIEVAERWLRPHLAYRPAEPSR